MSLRYLASQASVLSTTHLCRPSFSLLSLCPSWLCGSLSRASSESACTSCRRRLWVGVQLLRALPRPATRALYGLYGVHELLEDHRVVYVGPARHHRQRDAPSVRNKVALRARFSLIRWILASFLAPLFAGMEAESKEARSQSIRSASPRRSKRTLCSLSHTPASCHSRKRRQQVTPEPQPISLGSISQGMPLFKTKMMPASAERLSTRGVYHLLVWEVRRATTALSFSTVRRIRVP